MRVVRVHDGSLCLTCNSSHGEYEGVSWWQSRRLECVSYLVLREMNAVECISRVRAHPPPMPVRKKAA